MQAIRRQPMATIPVAAPLRRRRDEPAIEPRRAVAPHFEGSRQDLRHVGTMLRSAPCRNAPLRDGGVNLHDDRRQGASARRGSLCHRINPATARAMPNTIRPFRRDRTQAGVECADLT
jgi:hypothetical protein